MIEGEVKQIEGETKRGRATREMPREGSMGGRE